MSLPASQPVDGSVAWALLSGDRTPESLQKEDVLNFLREVKMVYTVAEVAFGLVALMCLSEFALIGALGTGLAAVLSDDGRVVTGRIIERLEEPDSVSGHVASAVSSIASNVSLAARSLWHRSIERGHQSQALAEIRGIIQGTWVLKYAEPYLNLGYLDRLLSSQQD